MICPVTVISARPPKAEIRILASDLEVCVRERERERRETKIKIKIKGQGFE